MKLNVIVDTDPGHDDVVAILVAHHFCNLLGITTVSGNVGIELTTRNALALVEHLGVDLPVHKGASRPLVGEAQHAEFVHGETGLGGVDLPPPQLVPVSEDAVAYLLDSSRNTDNLWIVAIGPLTNLALALQQDPEFASRIAGITVMGGSTGAGNVTAAAEFNIWADPEAADVVFRSGARLLMCGLNLTHQIQTSDELVAHLQSRSEPTAALLANLFLYLNDRMEALVGERRSSMHDPCAVLAITHPHLFEFGERAVSVELTGTHTRGMTLVDERTMRRRAEPNVEVAFQIDAQAAWSLILECL